MKITYKPLHLVHLLISKLIHVLLQVWGGSDSEEEEEGEVDRKEEEGDRGEQEGEKEMGAKDDKKTPQGEEDDRQGNEDKNDKKKEINEMEEPEVDDDQIDPHHGKNCLL